VIDKFQFIEQNKQTPTEKSVGVISLFTADQIFVFSDSRGRLSLQGEIKLPYEKHPFASAFSFESISVVDQPLFKQLGPLG